jgi:hypothetical protein
MVEMVGVRQVVWFVMLKSAKDRVIGVDTLEQQVLVVTSGLGSSFD